MKKLTVTVSGSFHRHISAIQEAVQELMERGVEVLSPADPRIVDSKGPFLFVASDQHRSIRLVQDRHLASIIQSDFLWLVTPDGYVGQSASLELGFAIAVGIPIFAEVLPPDLTLRQYIEKVPGIEHAIKRAIARSMAKEKQPTLLIDPSTVVELAHQKLDVINQKLNNNGKTGDIEPFIFKNVQEVQRLFLLPGANKE